MWFYTSATILLSLTILLFIYSNRKIMDELISSIQSLAESQTENVTILVRGVKEDNAWQVAAIKRYLGDVLGESHNPGTDASTPSGPRLHRKKVIKKQARSFTPEQKAASSLRAKEMWAKRREAKIQQGELK